MATSSEGIALIKSFEGCRLKAYQDSVGIWTIGYGCTGSDVKPGMTITQEEADKRLADKLVHFEDGVDDLLEVDVTDGQFSALVCFAYNVGLGNLKGSHLLSKTNAGDVAGAANEFERWDRAGGQVLPGLLRRRLAEKALYLSS